MTNLNKIDKLYNVHSHKQKEIIQDLLKNHLPKEYTLIIINKLNQQGIAVSSQAIRNVKCGLVKNIRIFNAIIELSMEHKNLSDCLKNSLISKA